MTELVAGPETDRRVAEAVGFRECANMPDGFLLVSGREKDEISGVPHPTTEGDIACDPFRPSVDWRDAHWAANAYFKNHLSKLWEVGSPPDFNTTTLGWTEKPCNRLILEWDEQEKYRFALEAWNDNDYYEHYYATVVEGMASTPELAICACILDDPDMKSWTKEEWRLEKTCGRPAE